MKHKLITIMLLLHSTISIAQLKDLQDRHSAKWEGLRMQHALKKELEDFFLYTNEVPTPTIIANVPILGENVYDEQYVTKEIKCNPFYPMDIALYIWSNYDTRNEQNIKFKELRRRLLAQLKFEFEAKKMRRKHIKNVCDMLQSIILNQAYHHATLMPGYNAKGIPEWLESLITGEFSDSILVTPIELIYKHYLNKVKFVIGITVLRTHQTLNNCNVMTTSGEPPHGYNHEVCNNYASGSAAGPALKAAWKFIFPYLKTMIISESIGKIFEIIGDSTIAQYDLSFEDFENAISPDSPYIGMPLLYVEDGRIHYITATEEVKKILCELRNWCN